MKNQFKSEVNIDNDVILNNLWYNDDDAIVTCDGNRG